MKRDRNLLFPLVVACFAVACADTDMRAISKAPDPQRTPVLLPQELPLPADVTITPPGPDIPPQYAAFVGKWGGRWSGSLIPVLLVVERVSQSGAVRGVYVWGNLPSEAKQRGTLKIRAQISNGMFRLGTGARLEFKLVADGSLLVNHYDDKGTEIGELKMKRIR